MSVGAELAQARQQDGLSLEDIASRTKIKVERLRAIEDMDRAELPSLIYLKGFLRAYATELRLDADDIVQRYLDEAGIEQPMSPVAAELAASRAVAHDDDGRIDPLDEFAPDDEAFYEPMGSAVPPVAEAPPMGEPVIDQPAAELPLVPTEPSPPSTSRDAEASRRSAFFRVVDPAEISVLPDAHRAGDQAAHPAHAASRPIRYAPMVIVALIAVVAGFLLVSPDASRMLRFGPASRAVTQSAKPAVAPRDTNPPRATEAEATPRPDTTVAVPPADTNARQAEAATRTATPSTASPSPRRGPRERAQPENTSDAARAAESASADAGEPAANRAEHATSGGALPDVSGAWIFTNSVQSSSVASYQDLQLGFRVQLQQSGDRITGVGQKWTENGRPLGAAARTPIAIEGIRRGDRLDLRFTEKGLARTSSGRLVLDVAEDGSLRGTFASSAANSHGLAVGTRAQ